jgi:tetratricopeptide (TPR) repeat protein/TolB-like protein
MHVPDRFLMRKALRLFLLLLIPWRVAGASEVHAVLVFPFENRSSRADLNWVSESFAETLSSRLSGPSFYVLERAERNAACDQLGIPADTPLTVASEYKVAQTLGVDWAVLGKFDVEGSGLTASARLLDLRQLKLSPVIEVTGDLTELVDLQTRLVWRLMAAHDPHFTVGAEEDFNRRFPEVRLDAFENYIRGILATDDPTRIQFFLESDRLDPADHRAAFALGRLYFGQKDYANSAKWLRKLGPDDPHYLESFFLFGVDEFFLGHYPSSKTAFERIGREIPLDEVANNAGVLEARAGRDAEALEDFERASKGDPTDADFCFNRGVALWNLRRYNAAAKSLEEAIRLNDDDSEAHTLLAVVLGALGDAAGERTQLEWLGRHQVGSEAPLSRDVLPQPRLKKNFDERAFRLLSLAVHNALEERLASMPADEHAAVHKSRGKNFLSEGRLSEAERELAEATSLAPRDSEAHLSLAQILEAEDKHQEAVGEFQAALKLQDSFAGHLGLARVYISLDRREQARHEGEAALKLDPGNREAQELLRQILAHPAPK